MIQWRSSVNLHNWNTGRPLEPQVHWDATGITLADASTQWCPVLICMIGTDWNTTGKPLEDHWKRIGYHQFFLQWHSSVHWGLNSRHTGLPLEYHWLRVRVDVCYLYTIFPLIYTRALAVRAVFVWSLLGESWRVCTILFGITLPKLGQSYGWWKWHKLQLLQCVGNGVTAVLHWAIGI